MKAPQPPKGGVLFRPAVQSAADKPFYSKLAEVVGDMRHKPTEAESKIWEQLKNRKLGVKFRRQHIIDRFIVDFYCVEKALVVEIDGSIHDFQRERDNEREIILKKLGCIILRFTNEQVLSDIDSVVNKIANVIAPPLGGWGASNPLEGERASQ